MSSAPRGERTHFDGGRRPWNIGTEPVRKKKESEQEARERETCLACKLPLCEEGSLSCGLREVRRAFRLERAKSGKKRRSMPVPDDFQTVAPGKTRDELAAHYGVTGRRIDRWKRESGMVRTKQRPPENFLYYGRIESLDKLAKRYGVSRSIVDRWRMELGVSPETKK